jgi:hypothetical protein
MDSQPTIPPSLYLDDETAWLDLMARLIAEGRRGELDYEHLGEYLSDMARRDRREVRNRLGRLLSDVLIGVEPHGRSAGRRRARLRFALRVLLESQTLRRHADEILPATYRESREIAAISTGRPIGTFPEACPFTVDELIAPGADGDPA